MNNLGDALKQAGYSVPEAKKKVDSSRINLSSKIEACNEYLVSAYKAVDLINELPNEKMTSMAIDSAVLNYQRYVEALKDILTTICEKDGIQLSDNKSLSEVIRKSMCNIKVDSATESAIKMLTDRNDVVHDYMNSGYYDEQVIKHIINEYNRYKSYLKEVSNYCKRKGYII